MTNNEREKLILNYMPLANKLAWTKKHTTPKSVTIEELQSAAYMGLVDAASRYDEKRGLSFGPLARCRICGEISDYLRELAWGGRNNPVFMVSLNYSQKYESLEYTTKQQELSDFFAFATRSLTDLAKRIVNMYYKDGKTMREIGVTEELSESRISQILSKSHKLIKSEFDKNALQQTVFV